MRRFASFLSPVIVIFVSVLMVACTPPDMGTPAQPTRETTMLTDPATYCVEQGYRLETRKDAQGNEYDVCIFDDGSECEEWAYFRGECTPKSFTPAPAPGTCSGNHHDDDHQGNDH
jgi:putative hemolysin